MKIIKRISKIMRKMAHKYIIYTIFNLLVQIINNGIN